MLYIGSFVRYTKIVLNIFAKIVSHAIYFADKNFRAFEISICSEGYKWQSEKVFLSQIRKKFYIWG